MLFLRLLLNGRSNGARVSAVAAADALVSVDNVDIAFGNAGNGAFAGAGAAGDDPDGTGSGIITVFKGEQHISADGTGNKNTVGVTRRGNDLNTESAHIPGERTQNIETVNIEISQCPAVINDSDDFDVLSVAPEAAVLLRCVNAAKQTAAVNQYFFQV